MPANLFDGLRFSVNWIEGYRSLLILCISSFSFILVSQPNSECCWPWAVSMLYHEAMDTMGFQWAKLLIFILFYEGSFHLYLLYLLKSELSFQASTSLQKH